MFIPTYILHIFISVYHSLLVSPHQTKNKKHQSFFVTLTLNQILGVPNAEFRGSGWGNRTTKYNQVSAVTMYEVFRHYIREVIPTHTLPIKRKFWSIATLEVVANRWKLQNDWIGFNEVTSYYIMVTAKWGASSCGGLIVNRSANFSLIGAGSMPLNVCL